MAIAIKPEVLDQIIALPNWTFAAAAQSLAFELGGVFLPPAPPPRPALVVPVDIQALYVPAGHREKFVRLPMELGGPAGDNPKTPPFSTPRPRAKGVHLHWALPDGLLRGELQDDDDGPVSLRALPNRWLVVRMTGRNKQRRIDQRAWVIESDTGKVFDLNQYPGGQSTGDSDQLTPGELDGIVGGSPSWTAGYDATRNRFAFHDPLTGVKANEVTTKLASYVVMGWWSERMNDPLSASFSPYTVSRKLDAFGWTASTAPIVITPTNERPPVVAKAKSQSEFISRDVSLSSSLAFTTSQFALESGYREYEMDEVTIQRVRPLYDTLMHGAVYGVPITGGIGKDAAPNASSVDLSMAPTLERLMAAQAAKGLGVTSKSRKELLERLMTAVANGSIQNLGRPDGVVTLDEAEHSDGFETFQGPETYEDVIVERHQADLKAGRPARTRLAAEKSGDPPRSEVMWDGNRTGGRRWSELELRQSANDFYIADRSKFIPRGAEVRTVKRPGPRYHRAVTPVIGLRNFGRSNRFLRDGRFSPDGRLTCRWVRELATSFGQYYNAADYLPIILNRSVPAAANAIMRNSFLYDPYIMNWVFPAVEQTVPAEQKGAVQNRVRGEMALRYSADGVYDGTVPIARTDGKTASVTQAALNEELLRFSLAEGREPSPVAITSWSQPWSPVWLEWQVDLQPGHGLDGWSLGRVAFDGDSETSGKTVTLRGRSPITTGLARTYQAVIDSYLIAEDQRDEANEGEISENHERTLGELSEFLGNSDLGSVTLDRVNDLWLALDTGPDGQVEPAPAAIAATLKEAGLPRLISSGKLRLTRARVVDTFGRFRDLRTDRTTMPVALETKTENNEKALNLPPRLTLPARLMWRFVDPADTSANPAEARLNQADRSLTINPLAGYILPDFMDESIEFFDQDGAPLGEVLHDPVTGGLAWEGAVGREGPAATQPSEGLPPSARACGAIAQGMIDADMVLRNDPATEGLESPLSAFLRAVDTTMWSVDANIASAGATIAGLVGRPVAVVSAVLRLDIPTELELTGAFGDEAKDVRDHLIRERVFETIKSTAFSVRLGEVAKGHDGLYGYFLNDDFNQFHLIEKSVAAAVRMAGSGQGFRALLGGVVGQIGSDFLPAPSPLNCPYISASEALSLHSGQQVRLTMLMHPSARVHATTGILPRKSLELLRDWVAPGLERIAPSARIGPVLIDPDKVRLPKIAAFGANQSWTRRNSPITWRDDPILSATQAALLPDGRISVEEGYIRIAPNTGTGEGDQ